ncbi:hypothetical protein AURDEDRAFT_117893, partial [Auricularia subglabra TFB-10046 SS5]
MPSLRRAPDAATRIVSPADARAPEPLARIARAYWQPGGRERADKRCDYARTRRCHVRISVPEQCSTLAASSSPAQRPPVAQGQPGLRHCHCAAGENQVAKQGLIGTARLV